MGTYSALEQLSQGLSFVIKDFRLISFARNQTEFSPVIVNGKGLEVVQHAKLLGVTISSDLSWNEHVSNVVKKASKAKACKGSL